MILFTAFMGSTERSSSQFVTEEGKVLSEEKELVFPYNHQLIFIRGVPGTGKSTISEDLHSILGGEVSCIVDPDLFRGTIENNEYEEFKRLFNGEVDGVYLPFRFNLKKTSEAVGAGKIVIWNQPWTELDGIGMALYMLKNEYDTYIYTDPLIIDLKVDFEEAAKRVSERERSLDERKLRYYYETYENIDESWRHYPDIKLLEYNTTNIGREEIVKEILKTILSN